MFRSLRQSPIYFAFGVAVVALFVCLETSGRANGGRKAPAPIDTNQLRSSSPGSWTYIYWAHGTRGK